MNTREQTTGTERGTELLLKHMDAMTRATPRTTALERLSGEIGDELAGLLVVGLARRAEPKRERVLVF